MSEVKVGDKVRVARGEGPYWIDAVGTVEKFEQPDYAGSKPVAQVKISELPNGEPNDYNVGQIIGFYAESLDVIGESKKVGVLPSENAIDNAARFLGVEVNTVYRVLELAYKMDEFEEEDR